MHATTHSPTPPKPRLAVPSELSSSEAKLVYLYLESCDGATLDELQDALCLSKLSILGVMNTLSGAGYVDRHDGEYVPAS